MLGQQGPANPESALRILVVDDYPDTCETTATLLNLRGHVAHTALTGQEAIREVAEFAPDLVLLDIAMPGMNGIEVAQAIRGTEGIREPAIAAMSGYTSLVHKRRCASAGFDYYLQKPVDTIAIDQLLWFEGNAVRERFHTLMQDDVAMTCELTRSQLEFAGLMLDVASTSNNGTTRKACVEKVQRMLQRMTTYLTSEAGLLPSHLSPLKTSLRKLESRLSAVKKLSALKP
jgi:CheY-like chemotaxis protein